jgi:hypothetical protein
MVTPIAMLSAISRSSNPAGRGTTIITMISIMTMASATSVCWRRSSGRIFFCTATC